MRKRLKLNYPLFILTCLICMTLNVSALGQQSKSVGSDNSSTLVSTVPLFTESLNGSKRLRRDQAGNIYLLNIVDSTILVYDKNFKFIRRIGSLGQGPDDLRHPFDFALDRRGQLIIADTDNNRIQIMSDQGKSIRTIKFNAPWSVDVLSTGEILVTGGKGDRLIRIFSPDGQLKGAIGELAYTDAQDVFPEFHSVLNKGLLLVDHQNNIYWVGINLPTPTVRKYSREGKLLLEFHPSNGHLMSKMAQAREVVHQSIESREMRSKNLLHAVKVDQTTGDIWVLPASPHLQIYDAKGNLKREFALKAGAVPIGAWDVQLLEDGRFIVTNMVEGSLLFKQPGGARQNSNLKRR